MIQPESQCLKKVEEHLGRPLTPQENDLAKLLCGYGFSDLDVFDSIVKFIFECFLFAVQKLIARPLEAAEITEVRTLFNEGKTIEEAANQINESIPHPRI